MLKIKRFYLKSDKKNVKTGVCKENQGVLLLEDP